MVPASPVSGWVCELEEPFLRGITPIRALDGVVRPAHDQSTNLEGAGPDDGPAAAVIHS